MEFTFGSGELFTEFVAAILGIAVVAIWRMVNKYLPNDSGVDNVPPPLGVGPAAVVANATVDDSQSKRAVPPKQRKKAEPDPDDDEFIDGP